MKKIKKFFTFLLIYSFFIIIGDLIYSNFTDFGKINYNCFQYFNFNYKNKKFNYYDLKKNCNATESQRTVSPYKVLTDNNGYRYSGKKRDNFKNKILIVGDSQAYGFGVKYKDSIAGILENENQNYEIYNLGVPGYGMKMYWNRIKDFFKNNNNISHVIVAMDMTEIMDAHRWHEIPVTRYPVLDSHNLPNEIDKWDKIKNSNFKGIRLLVFYLRNYTRHIRIKFSGEKKINDDTALKSETANFTYTDISEHNVLNKTKFTKALNDIDEYFGKISELSIKDNAEIYLLIFPWPENLIYGQSNFNWENFSENICQKHRCKKVINLFKKFEYIKKENKNWKQLIYIDDDIHLKKFGNSIVANEITKSLQ
tara:strand:+ start:1464 stop:2564 length:1101 start_codon:yes stop_codon:yes gene_type:complete